MKGAVDTARLLAREKNRKMPKKKRYVEPLRTSARLVAVAAAAAAADAAARRTTFLITLWALAPEDP